MPLDVRIRWTPERAPLPNKTCAAAGRLWQHREPLFRGRLSPSSDPGFLCHAREGMDTETYSRLLAGKLAGTRRLDLSCGLETFPRQVFDLADSIEILNLSGNQLESLPDDLPRLHKLKAIFCSDNRFTRLPEVLGRCSSLDMVGFKANRITDVPAESLPAELRWLILTDNQIEELPGEIGKRPRLQKLMLAGNRLTTLPESMAACDRLELLRISANRLSALPAWLLSHRRLSWLAFGANRFPEDSTQGALGRPLPLIDWSRITLAEKLGEGASGVIHRALLRNSKTTEEIAVKLFRGAVTSDGLPESEWAACMQAWHHDAAGADFLRGTRRAAQPAVLHTRCLSRRHSTLADKGLAHSERYCGSGDPSSCIRHPARRPVCPQHTGRSSRQCAAR
jgi:hypothetical protein